MVTSSLTIQDVLALGKSNGKKIDRDAVLPFILLPILMIIATISELITLVVMVFIGMAVLYVESRPRQKNRSPFFFSWTVSSGIFMFLVFELGILRKLKITQLEHFVLLLLLLITCLCFYKMKAVADFLLARGSSKGKEYSPVITSDSLYCQICQIEVNERFFHSIWWNCCILRPNYIYFIAGQLFAFATLLVGINLGLTTICHPTILYGNLLRPNNCDDAYFDFSTSLCFVTNVYAVGYSIVIMLVLLYQMAFYIPKYTGPQLRKLLNANNV